MANRPDPYYDDVNLPMHLEVGYHISAEADHDLLYNRDKDDQHPISAITNLEERLEEIEKSKSADEVTITAGDTGLALKGFATAGENTSPTKVGNAIEWKTPQDKYLPTDINNPQEGQTLLYDHNSEKWKNKDLQDNASIIYMDGTTKGLSIKGYKNAAQGQMAVKDSEQGIIWKNPVTDESLQEAVQQAQTAAAQASTSATTAGTFAAQAIEAAIATENKFWYGTIEEYNALEEIYESTIYIILDE